MTAGPLAGQAALITGGGRGLGAALCRALGGAGAAIGVADLRTDLAEEVARSLADEGCEAASLPLDVRDPRSAAAAVAAVVDAFGAVDILINNAGTDVTVPFEELTVDDWETVVGVNLRGPFLMAREAFPRMRVRGGGAIVNIVSTAAKRAWANASAYHASKWGLLGFSHALHVEGRPHGIKVTAVIAGGMRTPFLLDRFPGIDVTTLQDPAGVARAVLHVLTLPAETVVPELMVVPMRETSWP